MGKKILFFGLLLLICQTLACGYAFRHQQSNLPADVKTIALPVFGNRTNELRLEALLTEQIRMQFTRSQILKLVPESQADVILKGTIVRVSSTDVALTERVTSQDQRVYLTVSAQLFRPATNEILWQGTLTQDRTYRIDDIDNYSTESARREAFREAGKALYQTLHDYVLQNF